MLFLYDTKLLYLENTETLIIIKIDDKNSTCTIMVAIFYNYHCKQSFKNIAEHVLYNNENVTKNN